jgi:hypothetical protein
VRAAASALLAGGLCAAAFNGGCAGPGTPAPAPPAATRPADGQHAGITGPHGDHSPHHGGLVLMNGDVHYEVVMDASGRYEVWFTDAMRAELPASVASNLRLEVTRPAGSAEPVVMTIDDAGESWVGQGQPVSGSGIIVRLRYDLAGAPHDIEIPFVAPKR